MEGDELMNAMCGLEGCARPAPDGTLCWHHTWQLDRDLQEVPDLLAQLDMTISRQTQSGPMTEKIKGKGETPLAFNQRAGEAYEGLRDAVVGWARDYGLPWAEYATTAAAHLRQVLPDTRTRADLPKLCDEITDACEQARQAIDTPANRTTFPVGPCPEDTETGPCPGEVVAFIPTEDERPAWLRCQADEAHRWSSIQFYRVGERIRRRMESKRKGQVA